MALDKSTVKPQSPPSFHTITIKQKADDSSHSHHSLIFPGLSFSGEIVLLQLVFFSTKYTFGLFHLLPLLALKKRLFRSCQFDLLRGLSEAFRSSSVLYFLYYCRESCMCCSLSTTSSFSLSCSKCFRISDTRRVFSSYF